ncbi:STAS domain-containing protein [Streptomyces sp. NPDC094472]|uniref:STAS domain-containing protein n=1 Tax=Streptomyces sp. NPDC094472 TaxID=3155080 RepID=UPI00332B6A42
MLVPASSVRRVADCEGWAVLVLAGEVDLALAPALREGVDAVAGEGQSWIVLDLEQVTFMDSAGLGVVVYGMRRAEAHGGRLRLAGPGAQVRRLLQLTGADAVIGVFADVVEACDEPCR